VLAAISESVAVVRPDDVLAVRVPLSLSAAKGEVLRREAERISREMHIRIVLIAGEEFARITGDDAR
jgi:hypothetical protein